VEVVEVAGLLEVASARLAQDGRRLEVLPLADEADAVRLGHRERGLQIARPGPRPLPMALGHVAIGGARPGVERPGERVRVADLEASLPDLPGQVHGPGKISRTD